MIGAISPVNIVKFNGFGNFELWQRRVKDMLVQHGLVKALTGKQPEGTNDTEWKDLETRATLTIRMCLADEVMYHVMDEKSPVAIWLKLESRYMSKPLTNNLILKKKLYGLKMTKGSTLDQHINVFNQIISDLNIVDVKFIEEGMTLILLNSIPESYDNLVTTLMWGKETLEFEEITSLYYPLIKGRKAVMGVHWVKGLLPRVIRSVGETSLGVSRVETNLNPN